jgi:hypothetical protein
MLKVYCPEVTAHQLNTSIDRSTELGLSKPNTMQIRYKAPNRDDSRMSKSVKGLTESEQN